MKKLFLLLWLLLLPVGHAAGQQLSSPLQYVPLDSVWVMPYYNPQRLARGFEGDTTRHLRTFTDMERMSRRQIAGSALAFAGMVLVVLNGRFVLHLSPHGDLLALCAAWLWVFYSMVVKRLAGRYPALFITRKVFFYGLLTILPVFALKPFDVAWHLLTRPVVWGNLLFLGIVASMLCYLLWNAAMLRLGAVRTTNYIYLNPLVTILTAALCIDERITPVALAGAALILYGMWRAERAQ